MIKITETDYKEVKRESLKMFEKIAGRPPKKKEIQEFFDGISIARKNIGEYYSYSPDRAIILILLLCFIGKIEIITRFTMRR